MARDHLKKFWEAYRLAQRFEVTTPFGSVVIAGPDNLAKFMGISHQSMKCYLSTGRTEWRRTSGSLDFSLSEELREIGNAIGNWDNEVLVVIRRIQEAQDGE